MSKFKFELFDADAGGNVYDETVDTSHAALAWIYTVIDSYECEEGFADEQEICENESWNPCALKQKFWSAVNSMFFDSVSFWLPGHHRKITITQIEENN